jgi:hypothetical protein
VKFVDGYSNIIVSKAVEPIIGPTEPLLGNKKGANKQCRCGSFHIRDYGTHYSIPLDRADPLSSPLGRLLVDVPEYLAGATATFIVGRRLSIMTYNICKEEGKNTNDAVAAIMAGYVAESATGNLVFKTATSSLEKKGVSKLNGEPSPD